MKMMHRWIWGVALLAGLLGATGCARKTPKQYSLESLMSIPRTFGSSFSRDESVIAYISNRSGQFNIWTVSVEGGEPVPLTSQENSVLFATYCPNQDSVIFMQDFGGNENFHLFIMPAGGGEPVDLTPGERVRAQFGMWSHDGTAFLYLSNARDPRFFDVYRMELPSLKSRMIYQTRSTETLAAASRDLNLLAFNVFNSVVDQDLMVYNVQTGEARLLTEGEGEVFNEALTFSPDGKELYYLSDEGGEFIKLKKINLESLESVVVKEASWDIVDAGFSHDGTYFYTITNVDGHRVVEIINQKTGEPVALPDMPDLEISGLNFSRSERYLAFYANGDTRPNDLHLFDLKDRTLRKLTESLPDTIRREDLVESEYIRYPSFDGRQIPAYLYIPKGMEKGKRYPAIISVHGGPMAQVTRGFDAVTQFFVNHGYVVLKPNVRGSTGYGKTYHQLDDHDWGGAPLKDVIWGKKYLAGLGFVDTSKVVIMGGSYGGYMVLAALAFAPTEFAAGVDICGPSNLLTLLATIPPYWEPFRNYFYREVGNPETEADFLRERSPYFHADQIVRPLFVVQGANDPRVKKAESDQIVEALRKKGARVEYMIFPDEGHGLRKIENRIKAYNAIKMFLDEVLNSPSV